MQPDSFAPAPTPNNRSSSQRTIIFVIVGAVIFLLIVCGVLAVAGGVVGTRLFRSFQQEVDQTTTVIDQFMRAGAANDPQTGVALFGEEAQAQGVTEETIADLFASRRDLFEGYQSVEEEHYSINTGPGGTVAEMAGTLEYQEQNSRPWNARLIKENGQWKLVRLDFPDSIGQ